MGLNLLAKNEVGWVCRQVHERIGGHEGKSIDKDKSEGHAQLSKLKEWPNHNHEIHSHLEPQTTTMDKTMAIWDRTPTTDQCCPISFVHVFAHVFLHVFAYLATR